MNNLNKSKKVLKLIRKDLKLTDLKNTPLYHELLKISEKLIKNNPNTTPRQIANQLKRHVLDESVIGAHGELRHSLFFFNQSRKQAYQSESLLSRFKNHLFKKLCTPENEAIQYKFIISPAVGLTTGFSLNAWYSIYQQEKIFSQDFEQCQFTLKQILELVNRMEIPKEPDDGGTRPGSDGNSDKKPKGDGTRPGFAGNSDDDAKLKKDLEQFIENLEQLAVALKREYTHSSCSTIGSRFIRSFFPGNNGNEQYCAEELHNFLKNLVTLRHLIQQNDFDNIRILSNQGNLWLINALRILNVTDQTREIYNQRQQIIQEEITQLQAQGQNQPEEISENSEVELIPVPTQNREVVVTASPLESHNLVDKVFTILIKFIFGL
jgi:hypothetical protein